MSFAKGQERRRERTGGPGLGGGLEDGDSLLSSEGKEGGTASELLVEDWAGMGSQLRSFLDQREVAY